MPMNPRTLRPGSTFTPRSISGLALWLDAADGSSLYTTDAGPVTAVSAPTEISGCALWLDGADNATITASGGLVSQWNDKSESGAVLQASGSARPTLSSTGFNGRQALVFNGTSTNMASASAYTATNGLSGMTRIAVCQNVSGSSVVARVFSGGSDMFINMNGAWRSAVDSTSGTNFASSTTFSSNNALPAGIYAEVFASSAITQYGFGSSATVTVNGTIPSATGSGTPTLHVGSNIGANFFWNGPIAEVIYFNRALTRAELTRVEAYLAAKWGISGVHAQATATNDPVGYWRDKSGNGRHLTQSTGTSRPALRAANINGKRSVTFDGVDDNLWRSQGLTSDDLSMFCVYRYDSISGGGIVYDTGYTGDQTNANSSAVTGFLNSAGVQVNSLGQVLTRLDRSRSGVSDQGGFASAAGSYAAGRVAIVTAAASYGGASPVRYAAFDGAALSDSGRFNGATWSTINLGCRRNGASVSAASVFLAGQVCEFIAYDRNLPVAQRQRLERYLAAKWGITLAPQVSNADAQDWVNRVYANGGTVSSTTASAVNQFCVDIANAGIRDRFYRLNLFCGNTDASLIAVRTPLYRGPSLAGTQYGNSLDTNGNFAITDYAETGTGGGLKGDGSTKSLNTGVANNAIPATDSHLMAYESVMGTQVFGATVGASGNKTPNAAWFLGYPSPANTVRYGAMVQAAYAISSSTGPAMFLGSNDATTTRIYRNGTLTGSVGSNTARTPDTDHVIVFGMSFTTSVINRSSARLNAYSLGLGMTQQQQADFYTAMQAFQTALGRNV